MLSGRDRASLARRVRDALPHGRTLPEDAWRRRHRFMLALLWAHVPGLLAVALVAGTGVAHGLLEASIVAVIAALASRTPSRRVASALVATGLLTSSGILVHLSGGYIEAHFHFFVMVAVLAMYEDWLPFGLAVLYVALHHGVVATLDPEGVFNHQAAQDRPWLWAGIHAGFILAAGTANVVFWRMNEDVRAEARRHRIVQTLTDTALLRLSAGDMLDELLARLSTVLNVDTASVQLLDPEKETLRLSAAHGLEREQLDQIVDVPLGEGLIGRVALDEQPLVVEDVDPDDIYNPALRDAGIRSLIGVPLMVEQRMTGVLAVATTTPRRFDEDDGRLLQLVADRVALAIDHARLFEHERRIAETLQRSLLPDRLPDVPGLQISARYLPGAEGTQVGGDWFDVISLPGGQIGLVMGDVVGRGIRAASLMGQLRNALRAYALDGHGPAAVVARLNRMLAAHEADVTTLVYMVLDPEAATLRIARAGHLPPLLVAADGRASYLEGPSGLPLGALPVTEYEESVMGLEPGTTLVLFTDGLVERAGDNIQNGLERVRSAMPEQILEPNALCDELLERLIPEGAGGDDVALLVFRTLPLGDRLQLELPAEPRVLASVRQTLRRWLGQRELPDATSYEITLACDEAVTNAIEHASRPGRASFELRGRMDDHGVEIEVRDHGQWRAERENDRGRGLGLLEAMMDEVDVEPSPDGTTVRMRRRIASTVATA